MTHLLAPDFVQRTKQERDANKKSVQSGENDGRDFGIPRLSGTSNGT